MIYPEREKKRKVAGMRVNRRCYAKKSPEMFFLFEEKNSKAS
jgi:hypothetical protein